MCPEELGHVSEAGAGGQRHAGPRTGTPPPPSFLLGTQLSPQRLGFGGGCHV